MRVGIAGYKGRMGQMLVRELESGAWPDLSYSVGTTSQDSPEQLLSADVIIDFTTPSATRQHIWLAAKHHKPLVVGTTGLTTADMQEMRDATKECPLLFSANMSIGINLLAVLVEQASARLGPDYDIEILETHHHHKVDAPSGTALMLGKATGRQTAPYDRSGKRERGTVGYAVQRGGDVIGEHTVSFLGSGERLELGHRAHDRSLFAKGALRAAQWLSGQNYGLYSMRDVLGF
ncbi:MAG: 4-hydroxy-tetrahydrodipicolinate reductase [Micavibrio aeruginosavorus]|uniref:4-hydroxy-tetrahydrodipicolinate reductase n=1 Tax=Micavibrio aeruginosavorus TaxID=349221 RepID=A0A7T5R3Y0_9BACT|nr:MAG: 4-hydroxy-tetrahydrodipicolinate reductase [Micavibrio aeruginosavorus]